VPGNESVQPLVKRGCERQQLHSTEPSVRRSLTQRGRERWLGARTLLVHVCGSITHCR